MFLLISSGDEKITIELTRLPSIKFGNVRREMDVQEEADGQFDSPSEFAIGRRRMTPNEYQRGC